MVPLLSRGISLWDRTSFYYHLPGDEKLRLDILIYAHDGRGLGHLSRSLGIGMALRRLFPELKILVISGSAFTSELIGRAPLDWLKLAAYKTEVVEGQSRGVVGNSMFSDKELGELRSRDLCHIVTEYRPKLVLVDHTPQGKHRELLQALEMAPDDCQWVLGVRGVVGAVKQAKTAKTTEVYQRYYSDLLWYGDTGVLGSDHFQLLSKQYGVVPFECGYVSRLCEYLEYNGEKRKKYRWAGVVSVPWLGEKSLYLVKCLADALERIPSDYGPWCLFVDTGDKAIEANVAGLFSELDHCHLKQPGKNYAEALVGAESALIYGGYNSLVDVISLGIPTLVILRDMKDQEQQAHAHLLQEKLADALVSLSEEDVTADKLEALLLQNLNRTVPVENGVNVNGATRAANYLYSKLS
jgi:predicted glycosyltransferase